MALRLLCLPVQFGERSFLKLTNSVVAAVIQSPSLEHTTTTEVLHKRDIQYYDGPDCDEFKHRLDIFYPSSSSTCDDDPHSHVTCSTSDDDDFIHVDHIALDKKGEDFTAKSPLISTNAEHHNHHNHHHHHHHHHHSGENDHPLRQHPVIVFVHGGGWMTGDRYYFADCYGSFARCLASAGFVVVVISYRLSPVVRHPEHVRDLCRALRWVNDHITEEVNGDPRQLFLCGHSAGGHMASLVGLNSRWLEEVGLSPKLLRGVVGISGVYDTERLWNILPVRLFLINPVFGNTRENITDSSPCNHCHSAAPPFLLMNAQFDLTLQIDTLRLSTMLRDHNCHVETSYQRKTNHYTIVGGISPNTTTIQRIIEFVNSIIDSKNDSFPCETM